MILASATGYAILTIDAQGQITSWNEGARLMLGWDRSEVMGQHTRAIFTPEDRTSGEPEKEMHAAAERGSAENERWHVRKDGSRFFAIGLLMPLRDRSGGFVKVMRDRTEQLHVERNQLRRLEQMKALANAARTIVTASDLGARLDAITVAARTMIGAHRAICTATGGPGRSQTASATSLSDEYTRAHAHGAVPGFPDVEAQVFDDNRTVRLSRADLQANPRSRSLATPSGDHPLIVNWLAAPLVGRDGRNLGLIQLSNKDDGSDFDEADEAMLVHLAQLAASAVEQSLAERAIASREAHLSAIFDQSAAGLAEVDATGRFVRVNDRYCQIVGRSRGELLSLRMQDITHPEDLPGNLPLFYRATEGGQAFEIEKRYLRPDGSSVWVLNSVATVRDGEGRPASTLCVTVDVTAQRTAEAALRESEERLRFLDRLTASTQGLTDPTRIMAMTAELLGRHLGVAVCAYADMEPDEDGFTIRGDWTAPGFPSIVGAYRLQAFGVTAAERLRSGRPLITRDTLAELGAEQAELFLRLGLRATVCMPLVKGGRLTALMAVHSASPRDWSDEALALVAETTERSWAHIERVRSQAALQESEARFRSAVDAVQGVLWTNNAEGKMVGEQPGWAALTGQTFEEYQGYGWADAVHPEDAQATVESWNEAVRERKTYVFEHRVRRHDGQWRLFSIRAIPTLDADGNIREWVGVHSDVTEQRAARDALARETERLQILNRVGARLASELDLGKLVQEAVDAAVALTGAQFGAFFYNVEDERNERYMLYALSGVPREAFSKFPMPRNTAVFSPTFSGEGVVRSDDITKDPRYGKHDTYHGMPAGHLPVTSYLAVPVISRSGEVLGGLFFGHERPAVFTEEHEQLLSGIAGQAASAIDNARLFQASQREIAERRRAEAALKTLNETLEARVVQEVIERSKTEEALRQAQKMEAIGQLTGGVAHDFNNLLTIIRSSTDLLRRPGLPEERRRRYVDAIADTVDRASKLTGQLLAFARRQALKPEVFDVPERIRAVTDMLRTIVGGRIHIVTDIACERCLVEADVTQFETALVNMAVNARDAMDGEGTLTMRVEPLTEMPALRGHAGGSGRFVAVSLSDTGHGIPPDAVEKIFEPFFTTKEVGKGTGLGLSQVFGFAKQSGGDVGVRSQVGQGTTFILYLPRTDQDAEVDEANHAEHANAVEGRGRRVLVVEDNVDVGTFSTQILQDLGYETTWASNASEALSHLEQGHAVDVVFSDVVMPGMSGIELGEEIRRRFPGLPVVLTSGYSHVLAAEGRHGFELLHKPYAVEELSRVLRRVARGARGGDGS
ncbi:MAG TPA: PAS domain S-box protein [Salinarimonas sp.]|nr:PAS domain S-box protein [Salinarimonas sp.]